MRDFDDLIDRLEYATDTIFDLLWLYNISRLIVEKVVNYQDLLDNGSLAAAREKGIVGMEGKEYVVKDGDVILFRFNV